MLHRISPYTTNKLIYNENMKISPEEMQSIIRELKHQRKIFVSMDDLHNILLTRKKPNDKFIAITLDDGYKDNLTFGYDIFKKHGIPFCIYVTNSFPNKTTDLWWYALEDLVIENEFLTINDKKVNNRSIRDKEFNFLTLRTLVLKHHYRAPLDYFRTVGQLRFDIEKERKEKTLTWGEIETLSRDPLTTIGCHTMQHYPLRQLTDTEARAEINNSKTQLELRINRPVRHFAFPFGTKKEAGRRDYQIAAECEFETIVTTVHGHVHRNDDPRKLGRIFLYPPEHNSTTVRRVLFWNLRTAFSFFKKDILRIRNL